MSIPPLSTHLPRSPSPPATANSAGYRARVRIFNVRYSPNLGDGLLAECLEQALIDCGAAADSRCVDMAARTRYAPGSAGRSRQLRLLQALPAPARQLAVRWPLAVQSRRLWLPHYRAALADADCVVIGGGNLLTDLDLNFPTKIALAVQEAARRRLPVFLYACGVSPDWSANGHELLANILDSGAIRRVFVRDEPSRQAWRKLAGSTPGLGATLVRDPGLLAARHYGLKRQTGGGGGEAVGIGVTSPVALCYHAAGAPAAGALDAWYLDLARSLLARGHRLAVFTNGSPEDRAHLDHLRPALAALGPAEAIRFAAPHTPRQLAQLIAGLDGLAAFRMHAVITAYACGVPFVGLAWDSKLEAFLQSVGRADWLCRPVTSSGGEAAEHLLAAMRGGIPEAERTRICRQAMRGVAMLQREIAKATTP